MCPHGYHHNGSMATPALGTRDIYIYIQLMIRNLQDTSALYLTDLFHGDRWPASLQTYEQIPAKQHTHCSPRLDQLISLYSHVIPHERLILHVLLFIVLYWCDMYLYTSVVIQCLFQWIGRQVTCPHETDLSNKVLMYPANFWSSIVSYAPHQRVEYCLSGTWIQHFYIYIYIQCKFALEYCSW